MSGWRDKAIALKQANPSRTHADIARECGVTRGAVWKALNPERAREGNRIDNARRAAAKRAWENAHRLACAQCGRPMGAGSVRSDGSRSSQVQGEVCKPCRTRRRAERAVLMMELRAQGLSNAAIARKADVPRATVANELSGLRSLGFDVGLDPYALRGGGRCGAPITEAPDADALWLGRSLQSIGVAVPIWRQVAA